MKLISFLHLRVGGIFVSLRSYLLETAGGLKENRPNKSGCEKVRVVNHPHFCCPVEDTHSNSKSGANAEYIILNKSRSQFVEIFLTGCRAVYNDVRAILGMANTLYPPKGEELDS